MSLPLSDETARCRKAQADWAESPLSARLACIRRLRHSLAENADRLCLSATHDIGRPTDEVLATDLVPTTDALRFLERRAARILGPRRVPAADRPWWLFGERETVHRRPIGVVGIIGTWNYPILLNAPTIAQALVAGNGVVWKPSELVPTVAQYLHQLFLDAGFPPDLFVCLPADREFGTKLVEADVDHVVFTGSANVGRKVAARLGERLVPSTLELSGCDALFVLSDADVKLAARAAWYAATLNVGQTCLAVRRAFVQRRRYVEFLDALRPLPHESRPEPLALASQATQAESLVREALTAGASLLPGNETPVAEDDPPRFTPTVVIDASPEMAICREASFAPLLAVVPFDNEADLVSMSETCPYGLGASVFTSDPRRAERLAGRLRVGSVAVNDVIVGTAHPAIGFGGVRHSGWGETRGEGGLLALTVPQVVTVRKGRFRLHFHADDPAFAEATRGLLEWCHSARWRGRWSGFWRMVRAFMRFGKTQPKSSLVDARRPADVAPPSAR
jgi:acyl-CoA reductase-like NAD-dependent aldehyde dehydrogenase